MSKKPSKLAIAKLFSSLSYFQPERENNAWTGRFEPNEKALVNQSSDPIPDRDELLKRIGEASIEMKAWTMEYDGLMKQVQSFTSDGMLISQMIDGAIGKMPSDMPALERLDILVNRYRQMYDVLNNIAHTISSEDCKSAAIKFLQWKGDTIKPLSLVNQNEEKAIEVHAGGGEPVCTCKKPDCYENSGYISANPDCPIHGDDVSPHEESNGQHGMDSASGVPSTGEENKG